MTRGIGTVSSQRRQLIVFSDLDGTLLDHESYAFDAALPGLARLKHYGAPLILASSKTAAELESIQQALGISHPVIAENGAGVVVPDGYFPDDSVSETATVSAPRYREVVGLIEDVACEFADGFVGFSQMSTGEVSKLTGLNEAGAALAKERQWSEPGIWRGSDVAFRAWEDAIQSRGLIVTQGGRFVSVSFASSKNARMADILTMFRVAAVGADAHVPNFVSMALGDAPNDKTMICAADIGVVIKGVRHDQMKDVEAHARGVIWRPAAPGPTGWNEAVNRALDDVYGGGGA